MIYTGGGGDIWLTSWPATHSDVLTVKASDFKAPLKNKTLHRLISCHKNSSLSIFQVRRCPSMESSFHKPSGDGQKIQQHCPQHMFAEIRISKKTNRSQNCPVCATELAAVDLSWEYAFAKFLTLPEPHKAKNYRKICKFGI